MKINSKYLVGVIALAVMLAVQTPVVGNAWWAIDQAAGISDQGTASSAAWLAAGAYWDSVMWVVGLTNPVAGLIGGLAITA